MGCSDTVPLLQAHRWKMVGLLSLSVLTNYIDRGNLSVAAPALARELSVSPTQLGLLFSAFFWTYALGQIPAGWLADRFRVYHLYASAYLLWSVATLLTGFAHTLAAFLIFRLLLGLGESVAYPAYSQLLVRSFFEKERGLANSLIDVGTKAGPTLGTLLGGLVVATWGWRTLFFATGVISLLWLGPWYLWTEKHFEVPCSRRAVLRRVGVWVAHAPSRSPRCCKQPIDALADDLALRFHI